jgi:arylsulfatase A
MGDREIPGGKTMLTDWGTRVPLIVSWPGKIEPGRVSKMLVDASDLLPSLADAASATLPKGVGLDGRSILARLRGSVVADRRWVFSEHDGRSFVRNDRWKLYSDGQFFESEIDPDEQHPLTARTLSVDAARARRELTGILHDLDFGGQ